MSDNDRLQSFSGPRRRSARGAGYTFFVRALRVTLPVVALVIVGIVISRLTKNPFQNIADLPQDEKTTPGQIELITAKYEGVDNQGRPYTVTAKKASRATNNPNSILLDAPEADMTMADKTWVAVESDSGAFDTEKSFLQLTGNVAAYHDSGYEMHLSKVDIDIKSRHAVSTAPVSVRGPMGHLEAARMEVVDQGDSLVFGGPVKLTFYKLGGNNG